MIKKLLTGIHISEWVSKHYLQVALYNIILGLLILLRTAGYFQPFFVLSVNFIYFVAFILAIILFNATSKAMLLVATLFWILAGFFKLFQVNVWADRTGIYVFQALFLAMVLLFLENLRKR